jgi:hypothetical protein
MCYVLDRDLTNPQSARKELRSSAVVERTLDERRPGRNTDLPLGCAFLSPGLTTVVLFTHH